MKLLQKVKTSRLYIGIVFLSIIGCQDYSPKPKAYPRVIYPEKEYKTVSLDCPIEISIPTYSELMPYGEQENCWYNLLYTPFDATLHLSYVPIKGTKDLDSLAED
ncbi:MAG: hypothetical protein ACPGTP_09215, partial [Bacteroidia bacterium]